ncbi:MAG: SOS response-associated peptidase [Acidobacteriaceae bacterium]
MCGRYVRRSDKQRIAEYFRTGETVFDLPPDYNVAPTTFQPVIRLSATTGERKLVMMRWGLVPSWHKDPKHLGVLAINAQAESLMEKPMWRRALQKRRCLIPADGFYEWQKIDAKNKQPYAFGMKSGEPFAFAGLWERWMAPDGKPLDSFAIITTDPNEVAAKVHTRMPVIVEPRDYTRWLTVEQEAQPPVDLLRPYDAEAMKAWKVGSAVGNVRNNDPSLCEEVS